MLPIGGADVEVLAGADLVVVGGPTHGHGMRRPATRQSAAGVVAKKDHDPDLALDPDAAGPGVREGLAALAPATGKAAAFDTRVDVAAVLSGRASKGIAKAICSRIASATASCSASVSPIARNAYPKIQMSSRDRAEAASPSCNAGRVEVRMYSAFVKACSRYPSASSPASRVIRGPTPVNAIGISGTSMGPGLNSGCINVCV